MRTESIGLGKAAREEVGVREERRGWPLTSTGRARWLHLLMCLVLCSELHTTVLSKS